MTGRADGGSQRVWAQEWVKAAVWLVVVPGAALALGLVAVAAAERGAASRPVLTGLVIMVGALAALLPFRYGIPIAVVLAAFGGFLIDFAGPRTQYWNEAFVLLLAGRSAILKRPRVAEIVATAGIAGVYLAYLAGGTGAEATFWGAKVLVTSAIAAWAIARLEIPTETWTATYHALAFASVANLVLAIWQRAEGLDGLVRLGIPAGSRVKATPEGTVRAFGGFTSATPLAYTLALAVLCWLAFLVSGRRHSRTAVYTAWLPAVALAGIALSLNRTAVVALGVAAAAVALRQLRGWTGIALVAAAATMLVATVTLVSGTSREFLAQALTLDSESARTRLGMWRAYGDELSPTGAGPASAGSAYLKVHRRRPRAHVQVCGGWQFAYSRTGDASLLAGSSTCIRAGYLRRPRPRLRLVATAESVRVRRQVVFRVQNGPVLARWTVRTRPGRIAATVPPGRGDVVLEILSRPGAEAGAAPGILFPLVLRLDELEFSGFSEPTKAELIYDRNFGNFDLAVVDNQYVSWLFQYGALGGIVCALWVAALLWPMLRRIDSGPLALGARLFGVFLLVAAVSVNVWEEAPLDLLAAIVFGQAIARERAAT